ncbi:MAG: hypothetical protein ABIH91_01775 [Candidatus Omnitrophota bacterium]
MKICRFCEEAIGEADAVCGNCGYNFQTDTMSTSFVKKKKAAVKQKQVGPSSGIKSFMFWGMIIVIFSLGVKYQSKIGDVFWAAKNLLLGNKAEKSAKASQKDNQNKIISLIDVRSAKVPANKTSGRNRKIEGIFYDPQGKSYVVINGQLVSEKESFGDMLIKKINQDSVEITQNGQEQVLTVDK